MKAFSWLAQGLAKNAIPAAADAVIAALAYGIALGLRTGFRFDQIDPVTALQLCAAAGVLQVPANMLFNIYWRTWRFVSLRDALALLEAAALAGGAALVLDFVVPTAQRGLPLSTIPIGALIAAGLLLAYRLRDRVPTILRAAATGTAETRQVLIVGADDLGQQIAKALDERRGEHRVRAFVDDDPRTHGTYIRGHRVQGDVNAIPDLVETLAIDVVAIALRPEHGDVVRRVVAACERVDVQIRKIRPMGDALTGGPRLETIEVEDLLRREPVRVSAERCRSLIAGRRVLITGAAGSIGSELARQVALYDPSTLLLVDIDESRLFDLSIELRNVSSARIRLLDVRDGDAAARVFRDQPIDIVFHAAALKHAPLLESHILEAVDTNVFGTYQLARLAAANDVGQFVFISTDKAVEPQGVMGATKRLSELLVRSVAEGSRTTFASVRFGNVLASRGSVVPLFLQQIDAGGPVTVTDPKVTRYFMSTGEAVALVIEAASLARNGDVFMLDMGESVPIVELARRMIRMRGLRVGRDIDIVFTGLRPSEKLDERLRFDDEQVEPTENPRVLRLFDGRRPWSSDRAAEIVAALGQHARENNEQATHEALFAAIEQPRATMLEAVPQATSS